MRKMVCLLVSLMMLVLPSVSSAASQQEFDWSGGPTYSHNMVLGKTLEEISGKAAYDAYLYGLTVKYTTQDGSVVLKAFPDYGKSKCNLVHLMAWKHGKVAMNTVKEVCGNILRSVPWVPRIN